MPEALSLFAATGVVVSICAMQLVGNITGNPEVRVNKEKRTQGVFDNYAEGEKYAEQSSEISPNPDSGDYAIYQPIVLRPKMTQRWIGYS